MPKFEVGQVIHHRRYDYRGVIASIDPRCAAPDEWYFRNQTQPNRERPWYHVLVDGGAYTYVAEENLEPDPAGGEIDHPVAEQIFAAFLDGRYRRFSPN